METLRILVSLPLMVADAIWARITRDDEYDRLMAEQHARNVARSFDNE